MPVVLRDGKIREAEVIFRGLTRINFVLVLCTTRLATRQRVNPAAVHPRLQPPRFSSLQALIADPYRLHWDFACKSLESSLRPSPFFSWAPYGLVIDASNATVAI